MLARSKLNSIESKISEAFINNDISHEYFRMIINEEKAVLDSKKVLQWWIAKEEPRRKLIWFKKVRNRLWLDY